MDSRKGQDRRQKVLPWGPCCDVHRPHGLTFDSCNCDARPAAVRNPSVSGQGGREREGGFYALARVVDY